MRRENFMSEMLEMRLLLSTYDAAKDFSLTQNPNGIWSYGVRATETGDYAPFPVATTLDFGSGASGWNENSGSPPYVGINTTGQEYNSEGITLPSGVLVMHPGGNGEYADLRFTAPAVATLSVSYKAIGIDTNGTTTDEHVLYNGQEIGSGSINGYEDQAAGSYKVPVVPGDTLDFLVGPGSNNTFYSDATSMSVQITPTGASESHLVFSQQPKDGNERTPEPTVVKIEDSKNHVVTSATDGVTLFLQEGSDQQFLGYVPFFRGVASFTGANAPIVSAGTDTFIAEETSDSHQFSGSAGQVTSTSFHISELHLAFTREPIVTGADVDFTVVVQLEDDNNKPVKVPEVDPLINLLVLNESTDAPSGTVTAPFVAGKPVTLSIGTLGTFEIIASELSDGGIPVDTTTNGVSAPINVLGNHFRFLKQPGNIDVGTAASFIVGLVNYKNKLISPTGLTGSFSALLNNDLGDIRVVPITLINGKYDNSMPGNTSPLVVTSAGSFTITAADVMPGTDIDAGEGISPLTSLAFQAIAPHLIFTRQPTVTGVGEQISFAVELLNSKKQPALANGVAGEIAINEDGANADFQETLVNSRYDDTTDPNANASFSIPTPGTYVLEAAQIDPSTGNFVGAITSSKAFTIADDHLVFKRQPTTVGINTPIPFQVALEDPKNKIVPFSNTNTSDLTLHINAIAGDGEFTNLFNVTGLTNGVYDNLTASPAVQFEINSPGTYSFSIDIEDEEDHVFTEYTGVTSKVFKIRD